MEDRIMTIKEVSEKYDITQDKCSADIIDYIATPPIRYVLIGGVLYFRSFIGFSVPFPILQRCDAVGPAKELDVVRLVIVSHSFTQFCNLYI